MPIDPKRLGLALQLLSSEHGFEFERFANAFLASEISDLRPVGGIHDKGRDAFVYQAEAQPDTFVQSSVMEDWPSKITATLDKLSKNGFQVREFIYCTNRAIQTKSDSLRTELRKRRISLDVRDREWFLAFANTSRGRMVASEQLAKMLVDPLLADTGALAKFAPSLTREEERVAATYLQMELAHRDPERNLTKLCFDSLILYILRSATPEQLVRREDIHAGVRKFSHKHEPERFRGLVDGALERLANKGLVKHHPKDNAFTLAFPERQKMKEKTEAFIFNERQLHEEIESRVCTVGESLGIDFDYAATDIASDSLTVLDKALFERGQLAALAVAGKGAFNARRLPIPSLVENLVRQNRDSFRSVGRVKDDALIDFVSAVVENLVQQPSAAILERLRTEADAYYLLFALQETPDVQNALGKLFRDATVLIDTSIIIPAAAEILLPREEQPFSNLLRVGAGLGLRLVVGSDVLEEFETHLLRMRGYYQRFATSILASGSALRFQAPIIHGFIRARELGAIGSFDEFIERFMGRQDHRADLIEFLQHELSVEYDNMDNARAEIAIQDTGDLFEEWKHSKRRRPFVDDAAFERLVYHDVKALLLMEHLRSRERPEETYGYRSWWLTQDSVAFRFDRARRTSSQTSLCISPDFFARYVSLLPHPSRALDIASLIPACLELAGLGLIPPDIRGEAERLYESMEGSPEYLRRRKLRELANSAFATSTKETDGINPADLIETDDL